MKEISKEEFLKLDNSKKAKILKEICLGKVKYKGDRKNV
jgi:hypothetical protein